MKYYYHFVFHMTNEIEMLDGTKISEFIMYTIRIFKTYLSDLFDGDVPGLNIQHRYKSLHYFVEFTCESKEKDENIPTRIKKVFKEHFDVTEIVVFIINDI